jgi:DNA polymerase I-like protein with 3'-5' exonuclease and polymerase domains
MYINYFVDLETTVNGGPTKDSPEAHWRNNRVLLCGWQVDGGKLNADETVDALCDHISACSRRHPGTARIIAHNAKFDLKYLMRDRPDVEWHKVEVVDTMTWEYRKSGQRNKYMSLEEACKLRRVPFVKSLDLTALLDSGLKMEDIPIEDLESYLFGDVMALRSLYHAQFHTGYKCSMNYILPLAEMELNGMYLDMDRAEVEMEGLTREIDNLNVWMWGIIKSKCEWQDGSVIIDEDFTELGIKSKKISAFAERTTSFLLTGNPSELKITPKWRVKFKSGKGPMLGATSLVALFGTTSTVATLGFPMDEQVLTEVSKSHSFLPLPREVLRYRKINKLLGTYISPFVHTARVQTTIHPKLNTTNTATGRLSSSAPNGQNIPPEARCLIVPRFVDANIVELDFKQLEMVACATLTGDPTMLADLERGEDLHYNSGKSVMGWTSESDMTKEERKIVKGVNFGLLYGGKAGGLSKQTGADKSVVQSLIDSFYKRYPEVAKYQRKTFDTVVENMKPYDIKDGEQRYSSDWVEPTCKRKFTFIETKSPPWLRSKTGRSYAFSPQQTSNYPIQGFAGGDIVMDALYNLWKWNRGAAEEPFIFIMTVHDSIVIECRNDWLESDIREAMEMACGQTEHNLNLPLELDFDVEIADSWQ